MSVELLIDPLRISRQSIDIEVSNSNDARLAKSKVRAHLVGSESGILRIRLDGHLFTLFEDLDGLDNLKVVHVSARFELSRKMSGNLPSWCDEDLIVRFGLLDKLIPAHDEFSSLSIDLKILYLVDPQLVIAVSPEELLLAFRKITIPIHSLVSGDEVTSHIESVLSSKLEREEIIVVFKSLQVDNFASQLDAIFREIALEKIRSFVSRTGVTLPLPARQISSSLTSKLILIPAWWEMINIDTVILSLTQRLIQSLERKLIGPDEFSSIIYSYNKAQLDTILLALDTRPEIATEALLNAVRKLNRLETQDLENAIQLQLQLAPPMLLDINSSAKDAIDWSQAYLKYAENAFRRNSEPESTVSASFSDWVVAQPARLNNLQWNWRLVSASVQKALKEDKIVVLLVVDALGAVLSKPLIEKLRLLNSKLQIQEKILFAPLPTLTEIGKLAVTVGKDVQKLSGNSQNAIVLEYTRFLKQPEEFQFLKGWKPGTKIMDSGTRLLVFFENQLDDQLHECLSFQDLDAQLQIVFSKICNWVKQWMLEAEIRGRDIEIFITADHGLTKISEVQEVSTHNGNERVGERYVRIENRSKTVPADFYEISAEGAPDSRYLIPRRRVRLIKSDKPFTHGGLTPEEVLIPLITISRRACENNSPIRLNLENIHASLSNDGWSVSLTLKGGSEPLRSISIKACEPFFGELKVNSLAVHESTTVIFSLRSNVPQEGATRVKFSMRFLTVGATTYAESDVVLDVTLQARVLIRGQGEIDFDNMFD